MKIPAKWRPALSELGLIATVVASGIAISFTVFGALLLALMLLGGRGQ